MAPSTRRPWFYHNRENPSLAPATALVDRPPALGNEVPFLARTRFGQGRPVIKSAGATARPGKARSTCWSAVTSGTSRDSAKATNSQS